MFDKILEPFFQWLRTRNFLFKVLDIFSTLLLGMTFLFLFWNYTGEITTIKDFFKQAHPTPAESVLHINEIEDVLTTLMQQHGGDRSSMWEVRDGSIMTTTNLSSYHLELFAEVLAPGETPSKQTRARYANLPHKTGYTLGNCVVSDVRETTWSALNNIEMVIGCPKMKENNAGVDFTVIIGYEHIRNFSNIQEAQIMAGIKIAISKIIEIGND